MPASLSYGLLWLVTMFRSQGGSVSRLKAGGGPNAGGVAVAKPFCSPSVQKGPFSQELRCGA